MLNFEGKIIDPKYRTRMLLGDDMMKEMYRISVAKIIHEDEDIVSRVLQQSVNDGRAQCIPENICCDPIQPVLRSLDPILDERQFAENVVERVALSKYQVSIKSKVSAVSMNQISGASPEELSRVIRIDLQLSKRMLKNTLQRMIRSKNLTLHRRYCTNDRML